MMMRSVFPELVSPAHEPADGIRIVAVHAGADPERFVVVQEGHFGRLAGWAPSFGS
jgi:hypothetical protein